MAEELDLIATSTMGLEAVVSRELKQLGFTPENIDVGRTLFKGSPEDICRANIHLRTAGRVLLRMGEFPASDFGALFTGVEEIPWERWLPKNAAFPVSGRSLKSQLSSVPACQKIVKKALATRLARAHHTQILPENGPLFPVEVSILKDRVTLTLDTSGSGLHRRGYKTLVGRAPLRETLAAALVLLSVWNRERPLMDPFCGSGTILIEAVMIARNIAPGIKRDFTAAHWPELPASLWENVRSEARGAILPHLTVPVLGCDLDAQSLNLAQLHAQQAGVTQDISFIQRDFRNLQSEQLYGCLITNPPYGEWIAETDDLRMLYRDIPRILRRLPTWSHFIYTAWPNFESVLGQKATRRRKIYNSRLECTYYQFLGPHPPQEIFSESLQTTKIIPSLSPSIQKEHDIPTSDIPIPRCSDLRTTNMEFEASSSSSLSSSICSPENTIPRFQNTEVLTSSDNTSSDNIITPDVSHAHRISPPCMADINSFSAESTSKKTSHAVCSYDNSVILPEEQVHQRKFIPVFGGLRATEERAAVDFANRLKKMAHHLRRWPTRRGITCFRIYDRDIPEIPLAVDRYENCLHISEYERPHDRTVAEHADWLDLMLKTASNVLDVPPELIFLKERRHQRGDSQYERYAQRNYVIHAQEGGLTFLVNLSDYLDTGLFLDHRNMREMVRKDAANKRVLNLFAYTGSFSVYAASGGAREIVTVDLSNTYLDWAEANMEKNGFQDSDLRPFYYVRNDAIHFLTEQPPEPYFELAVVDPPTFSNSKRLNYDWDVQRDHVTLLNELILRMVPGGIIYFSNNNRRFKLYEESIHNVSIREITSQTIPEDFRNKRIHRAWKMVKEK